jgi:hypothetical protein
VERWKENGTNSAPFAIWGNNRQQLGRLKRAQASRLLPLLRLENETAKPPCRCNHGRCLRPARCDHIAQFLGCGGCFAQQSVGLQSQCLKGLHAYGAARGVCRLQRDTGRSSQHPIAPPPPPSATHPHQVLQVEVDRQQEVPEAGRHPQDHAQQEHKGVLGLGGGDLLGWAQLQGGLAGLGGGGREEGCEMLECPCHNSTATGKQPAFTNCSRPPAAVSTHHGLDAGDGAAHDEAVPPHATVPRGADALDLDVGEAWGLGVKWVDKGW